MIGYISGPISNDPNYKKRFGWAAKQLTDRGYAVINPADLFKVAPVEEMEYEDIMDVALVLLSKADYLIQLPGWEASKGACIECGYARAQSMPVLALAELLTED
jgi:nucleoside 2-deoxyribosyltransferase